MIKLAGMWELAWNTPIKEIDLWEMIIHQFQVDELFMSPVSGLVNQFVTERDTIRDILKENKDMSRVFVDISGDVELQDFVHPANALYIFGKGGTNPVVYKEEDDLVLRIKTPSDVAFLWPHQAAAIILYDRMIKQWR